MCLLLLRISRLKIQPPNPCSTRRPLRTVESPIHSSSVSGCVVETPLDNSWHLLGQHRYISVMDEPVIELPDDRPESHEPVGEPGSKGLTMLIRSDGTTIELSGDWRVAED